MLKPTGTPLGRTSSPVGNEAVSYIASINIGNAETPIPFLSYLNRQMDADSDPGWICGYGFRTKSEDQCSETANCLLKWYLFV